MFHQYHLVLDRQMVELTFHVAKAFTLIFMDRMDLMQIQAWIRQETIKELQLNHYLEPHQHLPSLILEDHLMQAQTSVITHRKHQGHELVQLLQIHHLILHPQILLQIPQTIQQLIIQITIIMQTEIQVMDNFFLDLHLLLKLFVEDHKEIAFQQLIQLVLVLVVIQTHTQLLKILPLVIQRLVILIQKVVLELQTIIEFLRSEYLSLLGAVQYNLLDIHHLFQLENRLFQYQTNKLAYLNLKTEHLLDSLLHLKMWDQHVNLKYFSDHLQMYLLTILLQQIELQHWTQTHQILICKMQISQGQMQITDKILLNNLPVPL